MFYRGKEFLKVERGVLSMATGTGKTRTALKICRKLVALGEVDSIIVSTYGNDLLDQWSHSLMALSQELSFLLLKNYSHFKERDRFPRRPQKKILLISRNSLSPVLKRMSKQLLQRTILIHDEVHKLGSPANQRELKGLSDNLRFRLGLSATWEREYDEEGTQFIVDHIGEEFFSFGLDLAIQRRILAPFDYHPLPYELTEEDREKYRDVWKMVAARKNAGEPMSQEEIWTRMASIPKSSEAKLEVFEDFISRNTDMLKRCIIFVFSMDYGKKVLEIVHKFRPDFRTYFSQDDSIILERFAKGEIECLIACHRLSEGIDIQSLTNIILFSSDRAKLETIQRVGRCIRFDPKNPSKVANVIDFVRPDEKGDGGEDIPSADTERANFLSELSKIRPN